jgi:stage IV sporulation protein FB
MSGDRDSWSLPIGFVRSVRVGLHLFLVLTLMFAGFLAWDAGRDAGRSYVGWYLLGVGVYLLSLIVHQAVHILAAQRLGGETDGWVLGPLGDMRAIRIPDDPQSEFVATIAGPMTSFVIALICVAGLSAVSPEGSKGVLQPLGSKAIFFSTDDTPLPLTAVAFRLACWINWWIASANLIPAYPFDMGRALASILAMARPTWDRGKILAMVGLVSRGTAVLLLLAAIFLHRIADDAIVPFWLVLTGIAVMIIFCVRREEYVRERSDRESDPFGYDFSEGYTSLDRSTTARSTLGIWNWLFSEIRRRRRERLSEQQLLQEKQLDEILQKLHEHGQQSLTYAERTLLYRASVRYRRESRSEKP